MDTIFCKADAEDIDSIFELYCRRVEWMNTNGIAQWNVTHYLEIYPKNYYFQQMIEENLYVLKENSSNMVVGAVVLLTVDDRWKDRKAKSAFYIHNLVTATNKSGIGKKLLIEIEELSKSLGKEYLRLDCACDNTFLNSYYESMGFKLAGNCKDGEYFGNRREKKLVDNAV